MESPSDSERWPGVDPRSDGMPPSPRRPRMYDTLVAMQDLLQEEQQFRRQCARQMAYSLLRSCTGNARARERAQTIAHEALRAAKSTCGSRNNVRLRSAMSPVQHTTPAGRPTAPVWATGSQSEALWKTGSQNPQQEFSFSGLGSGGVIPDARRGEGDGDAEGGPIMHITSLDRGNYEGGNNFSGSVDVTDDAGRRLHSKAERRCEDLLRFAFHTTNQHMESEWAAVELLDYLEEELNPNRGAQRASQAMLDGIRVLPAPVAGDLFITCAARGDIGVILFYHEEGLPLDHVHTTLRYQALHAAVEFGHLDSARLLVAMGAKVDARGGVDDRSPLFLAALAKRWDACTWLLEAGASKNVRDRGGLTAYQAMAGSSDPEVAGRAGMLTDPPQRVVSVTCRGITHSTLTLVWSEPLKSYDEELFEGYLVEWRPMQPRPVCPAHSRHVAERVKPPRKERKKRGRLAWDGAARRPCTAGETCHVSDTLSPNGMTAMQDSTNVGGTRLGKPPPLTVQPPPTRRPHTGGGETAVNANGRAALPKWKSLEVDSYPLKLTALYPATNYMVRVSARTLAGLGCPSREAVLATRVAPPSAPKPAPVMVSATPNSITVGWVPPKYENGESITRYEVQRLVLDRNHPDWGAGRESSTAASAISNPTTTMDSTESCSNETSNSKGNSNADLATTASTTDISTVITSIEANNGSTQGNNTNTNHDTAHSAEPRSSVLPMLEQEKGEGSQALTSGQLGSGQSDSGHSSGDRAQIGVWIGQRTEKMTPYSTAGGLPTYCRALFRVRAGNKAGWGAWSLSSAALEAQDIILPIKRGATQMLMRWFNKPQADILKWELSRRIFKYGADFRGDEDDSWVLCSRDIPGLNEGESTFRCKGLMPGTEYQFRLRSFSQGSWQAREDSVVSSPFKTICSPPDPPPRCPRSRQLEVDPLVPGGMVYAGALLAFIPGEDTARDSIDTRTDASHRHRGSRAKAFGSGMNIKAEAADSTEAAIARGEARAEAEQNENNHCTSTTKDDYDNVGRYKNAETERDDSCEEKRENVMDGEDQPEEAREDEPRIRTSREAQTGECDGRRGGDEAAQRRKVHNAQQYLQRQSSSVETGDRKGGCHEGQDGGEIVPIVAQAGSTSMELEWEAGCTNGAVTTNYEVWGLADETPGPNSRRSEWKLAATTKAAPTVILSGLRHAQPYRFKVRALNGLGWSQFGPPTAQLVLNPLPPCTPPELADRGVTWLALKLRAPPGAGLVLIFELQMCRWEPGMSEGEEIWGPASEQEPSTKAAATTKTTTTTREDLYVVWDLSPGASYRFKVRTRTVFGWNPGGSTSETYSTLRRF